MTRGGARNEAGAGAGARSAGATVLLAAAIVAVALNQRPAVVSVAPVLGQLRHDTGLSAAMGGLLTTVPVLCFGAFAPLARRVIVLYPFSISPASSAPARVRSSSSGSTRIR